MTFLENDYPARARISGSARDNGGGEAIRLHVIK
jgi:hypothetical protein